MELVSSVWSVRTDSERTCISAHPKTALLNYLFRYLSSCKVENSLSLRLKFVKENPAEDELSCEILYPVNETFTLSTQWGCEVDPPLLLNEEEPNLVRAGLTGLCRYMILQHYRNDPNFGYQHLLGYKETSLKACSEVSMWTRFISGDLLEIAGSKVNCSKHLRYLESKLSEKHFIPSYKKKQFKWGTVDSLSRCFCKLHNNRISSEVSYLTAHLPTIVDLLVHAAISIRLTRNVALLSSYPLLQAWYHAMLSLPRLAEVLESCGWNSRPLPDDDKEIDQLSSQFEEVSLVGHNSIVTSVAGNSTEHLTQKIVDKLKHLHTHTCTSHVTDHVITWGDLPDDVDPGRGGKLPLKRMEKKRQQLENMYYHIKSCLVPKTTENVKLVDFCAGGGHLGLLVAYLHPNVQVCLVENKEESLERAYSRARKLQLTNVTMYQCNLTQFRGKFDIGTSLHGCGLATDLVLQKCLECQAKFVICPCCYGSIQDLNSIIFPRCEIFRKCITGQESVILGHAADKTEVGIEQQKLGQLCMELVDWDRKLAAEESHNYSCRLYLMHPSTCSLKNNIITGRPAADRRKQEES